MTPLNSDMLPIGKVSFTLDCGCRIPPTGGDEDDFIMLFRGAGDHYPCSKHGEQIIVRSTEWMTGWGNYALYIARHNREWARSQKK